MPKRISVPELGVPLVQPMAEYLRTDAWHKGDAARACEPDGPALVRYLRDAEEAAEADDDATMKAAARFGVAAHCAVFEPDDFTKRFAILPEGHGSSTVVKDAKRAIEAAGKTALKRVDYEGALRVRTILEEHPLIGPALYDSSGICERSIFTKHEATGLTLAIRPDKLFPDRGLCLDLKTTRDPSPAAFRRTMADFAYDVGCAWYPDRLEEAGIPDAVMVYIAVQSFHPYRVRVYLPGARTVQRGREIGERGLRIIQECLINDRWPAFGQSVEEIDVAEYLLSQEGV